MAVFFQNIDKVGSPRLEAEQSSSSIQEQLAKLRSELDHESINTNEHKRIQREIKRLERLDSVMGWTGVDEKNKKDVAEILKWKNADTIKNSDILTLRQKWVDIASLSLIDNSNPEKEIKSSEIKVGDSFTINFGKNKSLRDRTGAGDILPLNIKTITINGIPCERNNTPRPWYYDRKWTYQPVYDGHKIIIESLGSISEEDEKANLRQWKRERMNDMLLNEDKPLTGIQDDVDLEKDIQNYKTRAEKISRNFIPWMDVVKATSFRLLDPEWSSIANSVGLSQEKVDKVKIIMSAIGQHESNSNYQARGPVLPSWSHIWTAAIWRYQIMSKNWVSWSEKFFGEELGVTPENQDKVAFAQMSEYYIKYERIHWNDKEAIFREVAWAWYGRWSPQIAWHPDTRWYQWSVLAIYRKLDWIQSA